MAIHRFQHSTEREGTQYEYFTSSITSADPQTIIDELKRDYSKSIAKFAFRNGSYKSKSHS
jgi:hypothetical protein